MSVPEAPARAGRTLSVRTGRTGAAAKAGHNLLIHVTAWQATLEVGADPARTSIVLDADATSLRVREGTGGMQALGDDDKANIQETIDDEVLKRKGIEFRSTAVQIAADGSRISVQGELTLVGKACPIAFDLTVGDDGTLGGSAVVKQTDWGIARKPVPEPSRSPTGRVVLDAACRRAGHRWAVCCRPPRPPAAGRRCRARRAISSTVLTCAGRFHRARPMPRDPLRVSVRLPAPCPRAVAPSRESFRWRRRRRQVPFDGLVL